MGAGASAVRTPPRQFEDGSEQSPQSPLMAVFAQDQKRANAAISVTVSGGGIEWESLAGWNAARPHLEQLNQVRFGGNDTTYNLKVKQEGRTYTVYVDNRRPYLDPLKYEDGTHMPDRYGIEFTVTEDDDGKKSIGLKYMYFNNQYGVYVTRKDRISVKEIFTLFTIIPHHEIHVADVAAIHYYSTKNKREKEGKIAKLYDKLPGLKTVNAAAELRSALEEESTSIVYTALKALQNVALGECNSLGHIYQLAAATVAADGTASGTSDLQEKETALRAALFAIDRQVDDSLAVPTTELNAINKEHERLDGIAAGMLNGPSKGTAILACLLYTSPSPRDAHESRMPSSA